MKRRSHSAAFTLIEVLAAIGLLVLLAAAVMSFLGVLRDRQRTVGEAYERQRGLALMMERLDAEVMTCFADSGEAQPGISGTESKVTIGSRGVGLGSLAAEAMRVSSTQFSTFELAGSDLRVTRTEEAGASPMVLNVQGIGKVRFRYHDGVEWQTTFDSVQSKGLPMAIEVSVWFASTLSDAEMPQSSEESEGLDEDVDVEVSPVEVPPDRVRIFAIPDGVKAGNQQAEPSEEIPENPPS